MFIHKSIFRLIQSIILSIILCYLTTSLIFAQGQLLQDEGFELSTPNGTFQMQASGRIPMLVAVLMQTVLPPLRTAVIMAYGNTQVMNLGRGGPDLIKNSLLRLVRHTEVVLGLIHHQYLQVVVG